MVIALLRYLGVSAWGLYNFGDVYLGKFPRFSSLLAQVNLRRKCEEAHTPQKKRGHIHNQVNLHECWSFSGMRRMTLCKGDLTWDVGTQAG